MIVNKNAPSKLTISQSRISLCSLAGLHACRRLQQNILAQTTRPSGTFLLGAQQQTCAQKLSMSSNADISKWIWLLAPPRESQNVPTRKTKGSTTINAVQIAGDDKFHSNDQLRCRIMQRRRPIWNEMFNGLRIGCWQESWLALTWVGFFIFYWNSW
ncbi:hypothetical protein E4T42_03509 [Aureobasidium subglaciale]|nr:hypothetical protein E4T42_03509 [Aureobasidium subglaciale]